MFMQPKLYIFPEKQNHFVPFRFLVAHLIICPALDFKNHTARFQANASVVHTSAYDNHPQTNAPLGNQNQVYLSLLEGAYNSSKINLFSIYFVYPNILGDSKSPILVQASNIHLSVFKHLLQARPNMG